MKVLMNSLRALRNVRFLDDRSEVSSLRMFNLLILEKFLSLYLFQIAPRIMVLFIEWNERKRTMILIKASQSQSDKNFKYLWLGLMLLFFPHAASPSL